MRDAGGELTERGELLRLHQTILRGAQVFQRVCQFARARLHALEQAHVLDGDHCLVGEGRDQLDLLVGEWPRPLCASACMTPIGILSRSSGTPSTVRNRPDRCDSHTCIPDRP